MGKLTREEITDLFQRVACGDIVARNILVENNMGLVGNQARKHINRGIELNDLVSEGTFGLIKAVEDYDLATGNRFSTYAIHWIRLSITKALANHGFQFRLRLDVFKLARKCIMSGVGNDIEDIKQFLNCKQKTAENVLACMQASRLEDGEFSEYPIREEVSPEKLIDLRFILGILDAREGKIIRMKYGLPPYREMNFEEIAGHMSITREYVRRIHDAAILRIKGRF